MTRPADLASRVFLGLGVLGLGSLALITLMSPGATLMHAWPWTLAYAAALLAPAAFLGLRLSDPARPLVVPSAGWFLTALGGAAVILISGLGSPYCGPSLLWSTPLLAGIAVFFAIFDWLHAAPESTSIRREQLLRLVGLGFAFVAVASVGRWAASLPGLTFAQVVDARNPHPLGHSNYTAGLALLMLPVFASLARRSAGKARIAWIVAAALALAMLITSGSRGGIIGLAVLMLGALFTSRLGWKKSLGIAVAAAVVLLAAALANPRTRTLLRPDPAAGLGRSNAQRAAMIEAGLTLFAERPVLGWGPGTTPLAFPHVRHELVNGGVEDVLQLHCLPVQIGAELGLAGLAVLAAGVFLIVRNLWRQPLAAVTLAGYLAFALTDYQLDVPVFAFALAALAALLPSPSDPPTWTTPRAVSLSLRFALIILAAFARVDPTPRLNVRALALAQSPAGATEAAGLLGQSLAINPNQEIAHFNLGWLLVVRQPAEAETHFLAAARLVPDKGGVYFGLGLARLNQGHRDAAVDAFALECVNDPLFLTSPWWRDATLGNLRTETFTRVHHLLKRADTSRHAVQSLRKEIAYTDALALWLDRAAPAGLLLSAANTPERAAYFARRPDLPAFDAAGIRLYRRERPGYPVLMRNLDLPVPVDLFDVQENALAAGELPFLFPHKGWLPGPLLAWLLANRTDE